MIQALQTYWAICICRGNVADAPATTNVLVGLFAGLVALTFIENKLFAQPESSRAYLVALAALVLICLMIYTLLAIRQRSARFRKTLSAFAGTAIIMEVLSITIVSLFSDYLLIPIMFIGFWRIVVIGYILKHAMDVSLVAGILIAFAITFLAFFLIVMTFGIPLPTPNEISA